MYNEKLLRTLEDRFDKLQAYLFRTFDDTDDLYAFVAHIMYDKDQEECMEMNPDGTLNLEGKDLRNRVKQFLLPIVIECGGLFEEDKLSEEDAKKWAEEYKDMCINPDKES